MKSIRLGVIATFISLTCISFPCVATNSNPEKPSLAELNQAIVNIENIQGYSTCSQDDHSAKECTDYAREYHYLFRLVATAEELVANYDQADPAYIASVIQASKDAVISCNYRFGVTRNNYLASQSEVEQPEAKQPSAEKAEQVTSTTNPSTSAPAKTPAAPAVATTTSTSSSATTSPTSTVAITSNQVAPKPTTEAQVTATTDHIPEVATPEVSDIEVPATGLTESDAQASNKPLIITLTLVAVACLLIGSMIILNRHKPYRPGRKF